MTINLKGFKIVLALLILVAFMVSLWRYRALLMGSQPSVESMSMMKETPTVRLWDMKPADSFEGEIVSLMILEPEADPKHIAPAALTVRKDNGMEIAVLMWRRTESERQFVSRFIEGNRYEFPNVYDNWLRTNVHQAQ